MPNVIELKREIRVAAVGGFVSVVATWLFGLRVHVGLETVTGPASYVVAAFGGAIVACALDYVLREYWPV